jgi:GDPmannose 4,6-dehydratase
MGKIIVTGVTGQDGSYMVDYLLEKTDHMVFGAVRRLSVKNHKNIEHVDNPRFKLVDMDVSDPISISGVIREIKPDYFINFAANSFVGTSWEMPTNHMQTNTMGVLYQLEAIREYCPECRYYNAGSSEEFGDVQYSPQNEKHPLRPRSPYGASKASARHIVKVYRESYGLYAVQGWLFNHESERRGEEFVTRKITRSIAKIRQHMAYGTLFEPLFLGNLDARRDWSHAEDFVRGVWKMLNQDTVCDLVKPYYFVKDYVLASNEMHSVRDFVEAALKWAGIQGKWEGSRYEEKFIDDAKGRVIIAVDPDFYRPAEVEQLRGDFTKALMELNWSPKIQFHELVERMCENDLTLIGGDVVLGG